MGIENHDRLDQKLHTEEFISMKCGSLGYIHKEVPGGSVGGKTFALVLNEDGTKKTEKKYCGSDCPTLIAEHKAGG